VKVEKGGRKRTAENSKSEKGEVATDNGGGGDGTLFHGVAREIFQSKGKREGGQGGRNSEREEDGKAGEDDNQGEGREVAGRV